MARKGLSTATRSMPPDTADIAVLKLPSNPHQAKQAMLYIFEVLGTEYLKMGYTAICPWRRISWGFWELKHPRVCCGSLGWDDLQLLVLTYGRVEDEKYVPKQVPPECGEFWHRKDIEALCSAMESLVYTKYVHGDNEWKLPLPPRPDAPPPGKRSHPFQKSPCCHGGPIQQRRLIPDKKLKSGFAAAPCSGACCENITKRVCAKTAALSTGFD